MVEVVDFLNVHDPQGDFSHVVAQTVEHERSRVGLADKVRLDQTEKRTSVPISGVSIVALLGEYSDVIATKGRRYLTKSSQSVEKVQVHVVADETGSESVALETVGEVAEVAVQVGLVDEVAVVVVADAAGEQTGTLDALV